VAQAITPDPQGNLTLGAEFAELHGDGIKQEEQGGQPNLGFWDRAEDWASWKVHFSKAGTYKLTATCATLHANPEFVVEVAGQQLGAAAPKTGGWADFRTVEVGKVVIQQAGEQVVKLRPKDVKTWKAINVRNLRLTAE
jgi:hypothetical protein